MTESNQKKKVDISLQIFPGNDFCSTTAHNHVLSISTSSIQARCSAALRGELCSVPSSLTKSITRQLPWTAHEISAYINTLNYTS